MKTTKNNSELEDLLRKNCKLIDPPSFGFKLTERHYVFTPDKFETVQQAILSKYISKAEVMKVLSPEGHALDEECCWSCDIRQEIKSKLGLGD